MADTMAALEFAYCRGGREGGREKNYSAGDGRATVGPDAIWLESLVSAAYVAEKC